MGTYSTVQRKLEEEVKSIFSPSISGAIYDQTSMSNCYELGRQHLVDRSGTPNKERKKHTRVVEVEEAEPAAPLTSE